MNVWLLSAAGLSAIICVLHIVLGGREAARPLLASMELTRSAKFTNYYCWHLVTIAIGAMAVAFVRSSQMDAAADLAFFATGLALLFAGWSVLMVAKFRLSPWQFPQWALFLPVALLGAIGILS